MGKKVLDRVNIMGIYICKGIWGIHWRWAWHLLAFQRTWRMIVYHYSERAMASGRGFGGGLVVYIFEIPGRVEDIE